MVNDDDRSAAHASYRVLVETLTVLGKHRGYLVVVGGWVLELLYGPGDYIGSVDVDLAIDGRLAPPLVYESIPKELENAGYIRTEVPNRFVRAFPLSGQVHEVRLDLITGRKHATGSGGHESIQGMQVWCASGVDVALDNAIDCELAGPLPRGEVNRLSTRVASAAAFLIMKAMALDERQKEKDAYDIYYCLARHPGGQEAILHDLRALGDYATVQDALRRLRAKFATINSVGPVWAARVVETSGGDYENARRDAFERVTALLARCTTS